MIKAHRAVQVTLVISAAVFAVFTMFWTGLTFLLSAPPFSYSLTQIGLVGLAGLAGALAAQRAGRFHDHGWSVPATGGALLLVFASLLLAALGVHSIALILVAVVLIDVAIQTANVLNQTRVLAVDPAARSRLNAALVTNNFIGGAVGSALAGVLWTHGGWIAVTLVAALLIVVVLLVWLAQRPHLDAVNRPAR